jgi:hypothetical protein
MEIHDPPSPPDPKKSQCSGGWRPGEKTEIISSHTDNALDAFQRETGENIDDPAYVRKALRALRAQKPPGNPTNN